jgi:hypothetical protein
LRLAAGLALTAAVAAGWAGTALASTAPNQKQAKAIERAFLKDREVETEVGKIRLSDVDDRFAAVSYSVAIPELGTSRRAPDSMKAPTKALLKEAKGKWKPVPKAPKKVKKDLGKKAKSDIVITGEVVDVLTRGAACESSADFYDAGILNPASGTYLTVEFPSFRGPGVYPALAVHSLAALSVNTGGVPQYETGQGNDAFSPSGFLYVDRDGWGLIGASMAKIPDEGGTYPQSVDVEGYWVCR